MIAGWWPWCLVIALTFSFHNSGRAGQPGEGSELPDTLAPFHREGRCFFCAILRQGFEWRTQWQNDGVGINGVKAHGRSFPFPVAISKTLDSSRSSWTPDELGGQASLVVFQLESRASCASFKCWCSQRWSNAAARKKKAVGQGVISLLSVSAMDFCSGPRLSADQSSTLRARKITTDVEWLRETENYAWKKDAIGRVAQLPCCYLLTAHLTEEQQSIAIRRSHSTGVKLTYCHSDVFATT